MEPDEEFDPLAEEDTDEAPESEEDEGSESAFDEDEGDEGEGDEDADSSARGSAGFQRQESSQRQPSRAQRRVENALREAREAKDRSADLERQIADLRGRQQPQETEQQRRERLDAMDPWDREQYLREEQDQRHRNDLAGLQFQMAEGQDKIAFDALCARSPVAAKLRSQVEEYLANSRRRGVNAPRETVLKYLIGERALENAGKSTQRNRQRADENRQRQTGKPGSGRSDQGGGRERGGLSERAARAKRLEDMEI